MSSSMDETTIEQPVGETEAALLEILRGYLDGQEIGADDDFYAMGGDSLIALQVVAEAQERGIAITLRDLLYYPTARELAAVALGNTTPAPWPPGIGVPTAAPDSPFALLSDGDRALVPPGVADAFPACALQLGIIYQCEVTGDPRLYHSLIGLEVGGAFDEALFGTALSGLFDRHPALRTSFDLSSYSTPMQLVWASVPAPLQVERLETTDAAEVDQRVHAWRERELGAVIDWARPPLVRCHVVVAPGSFRFALAIHHAIVDGWSYARLIVDLLVTYDALLGGASLRLPELPAGAHREFVVAEREMVSSPDAAAFWQAEADAPGLLADRSRFTPAATTVSDLRFEVDTAALDQLREAARRAGTSLKCFVQGAFAWALGEWTGRDRDLVMGVAVNTRPERAGAELLVGLFLNTVPMRFRATRGSWADLGRQAMAAERRALPYLRYPLVQIEQRLGRPAFDASFNFANFHVYRELATLRKIRAGARWVAGKPGFPLIVDFEVDEADATARVIIEFDLALIDPERADRLSRLCQAALSAAGRDPEAVATAEPCWRVEPW